jgi:hypothetical protein
MAFDSASDQYGSPIYVREMSGGSLLIRDNHFRFISSNFLLKSIRSDAQGVHLCSIEVLEGDGYLEFIHPLGGNSSRIFHLVAYIEARNCASYRSDRKQY